MATPRSLAPISKPNPVTFLLAFAAIYLVWGSTFLAIRFAVKTLPPLVMMGTRHLIGGGILLGWMLRRKDARPEPRLWLAAIFSGAFCFLGCHGLLAWAELRVPSGLAALLAATLPIWMVLLARARGHENELTPKVLVGIALGLSGVAILVPFSVRGSGRAEFVSAMAIVAGEVLWAVGAIYSRGVKTRTPLTSFAAMQMVAGGAMLFALGLLFGEGSRVHLADFTPLAVVSLLFLIFFGSLLTFTAYTWLLQVSSPAVVSTHSYVNPVVAVFLGWTLAGEKVTARTMLGAGIILASVALTSIRPKRELPSEELATEAAS
ncbi:MAG TPA: EamA family transporter [Terriglobales bacterium]|nr:EamA family transporter [Terriglobales bacterium]